MMDQPPEDQGYAKGGPDTPPELPRANTPFAHPSRTRATIISEEPPPLPPGFFERCLEAIRVWAHQPERLPFWWHLTTRAREVAHWCHTFDHFQTSSLDFYANVDKTLGDQRIPRMALSRILWKESGTLSAERLYLRVKWNRFVGDVCAAPFGRGFFFSFWVFYLPPVLSVCHILGIMATFFALGLAISADSLAVPEIRLGIASLFAFFPLPFLFLFWVRFSRQAVNENPLSDFLLGLTVIGPFIDVFLRPFTYYERDTAAMFTSMIENGFFETVDGVTKAEGVRGLTELEKKPEMAEFMNVKKMGGRTK